MTAGPLAGIAAWVSRCSVAIVVLGAVVGALATATIVATLWPPSATWAVDAYASALHRHGVLLGAAFSATAALAVVVPLMLTTARRVAVPLVSCAIGIAAWLVATVVELAIARTGSDLVPTPDPWPLVAAWSTVVAHLAFATALAIAAISGLRSDGIKAVATTAAAAVAVFALGGVGAATLAPFDATMPLVMVTSTLREATQLWAVIVAVVLAVVGLTRLEPARVGSPALVFVALGVMPAVIGERVMMRLVAIADLDVHLHDTYFEVARAHMGMFAAGAAMLAVLHVFEAEVFGRRARALLAWPGAVLCCGGFLAHHVVMGVLGTRGIPRRYAAYVDVFADLRQVAQILGIVTGVGFVLVAAAWIVGVPCPAVGRSVPRRAEVDDAV